MNSYAAQMIAKTPSPWRVLATKTATAQTPNLQLLAAGVWGVGKPRPITQESDNRMTQESDYPWREAGATPFIEIKNLTKRFGSFTAVDDVSLSIFKGELFGLLGGSGCGKTTLLRMLAGFETPGSGAIFIDGADMTHVPPYERPVNMMFQSYALFPHMSVEKNIAYGLKRDGIARSEINDRVAEMLKMVELTDFGRRKPSQLSGGQRQRVALARALVKRPKVLLLDEPLAALDKRLREQTQFELMNIQDQLGVTFVVVTHDQEEAMTLSTRIAVMDAGRFIQIGEPAEIYENPASRFIANFIGSANLLSARVVEHRGDTLVLEHNESSNRFLVAANSASMGDTTTLAIRPEKILIDKAPIEHCDNQVQGKVREIAYLGKISTYRVETSIGEVIEVTAPNQVRPSGVGHRIDWDDEVHLGWNADSAVLLAE